VALTAREHFIAHLLLPFMLIGDAKNKMIYARNMMRGKGSRREIYIPSARIYELCRKAFSEAIRNKAVTKETRAKMSVASKGRKLSEETKKKLSIANSGRTLSPEHIEKVRQANTGTKHPPRSEEWKIKQRASHVGRKDPDNPNRVAAHSGANNPRAKTWVLERQDGTTFTVKGLKPWCKEMGISFDAICRRDGRWFANVRLCQT
jgi:hypothetical protein